MFPFLFFLLILEVLPRRLKVRHWVIAHILSDASFVVEFKQSQTRDLMKVLLLLAKDNVCLFFRNAVSRQQFPQVLVCIHLERAAMRLLGSGSGQVDDFGAVPWLVVIAFALRAVAVPDVVGVVLLELVTVDVLLLRKLLLPKRQ